MGGSKAATIFKWTDARPEMSEIQCLLLEAFPVAKYNRTLVPCNGQKEWTSPWSASEKQPRTLHIVELIKHSFYIPTGILEANGCCVRNQENSHRLSVILALTLAIDYAACRYGTRRTSGICDK
jgi:hypothetical protein